MENYKCGDYIYDISYTPSGYKINRYTIIKVHEDYIYCRNKDGVLGRFKIDEPSIFKSYIFAKLMLYKYTGLQTVKYDKKPNETKKFNNSLINSHSIVNNISPLLTNNIIKNSITKKDNNKSNPSTVNDNNESPTNSNVKIVPYRPSHYNENWRYDSPKLKSNEVYSQPSVPFKILPNGALVSLHEDDE